MLKTFLRVTILLTITLSAMTFSTKTFAKTGLNSKLSREVRLSLWNGGVESEFKDAYAYYMDLLETSENDGSEANAVTHNSLPDELLIPLMDL